MCETKEADLVTFIPGMWTGLTRRDYVIMVKPRNSIRDNPISDGALFSRAEDAWYSEQRVNCDLEHLWMLCCQEICGIKRQSENCTGTMISGQSIATAVQEALFPTQESTAVQFF
ncbi:hypothetical protein M513_09396 [Trichuris suis]|uniref:Uncharacterized protein n=1 Tax=Trichuris suis TaxID=68888 RepID=A0A085LXK3_9BILA|nr:hypothetical protein M513_09396 [Trichuris suis]